jgi:uncharacterized protein YbbK (DUF523 family)/uncharacterized protein YbgA (DUF1722 family)
MKTTILRKPTLVVSACLAGQPVRYDGGHTRARFVTDRLSQYVNLYPVCPESGAGMPTPREAVRLVQTRTGEVALRGRTSQEDWTDRFMDFSDSSVAELLNHRIAGFILKRGSPSCGVFGVRRYDDAGGRLASGGSGLYARRLQEEFPHLAMEEEGRLNDPALRHHFLVRVFAAHRVEMLRESATTMREVMAFHRSEKLLLMAHNPLAQRDLGRLIGQWDGQLHGLISAYADAFHLAIRRPTHRGLVVNALQHMAGYLRDCVDDASRSEVTAAISRFEQGLSDETIASTLLRHHIRHQQIDYLADQTILSPYPDELRVDRHAPHVPDRDDRVRRVRACAADETHR